MITDKRQIEELMKRVEAQKENAHIHKPYAETWRRKPDFEVEYQFDIDPSLGPIKPTQGIRCDFLYEGDDSSIDGVHIIWPEFLDESGNVIMDKRVALPCTGRATMWVGMNEAREMHKNRIKVGTKGYWVVGSWRLAKVTVTRLIGLGE